MSDYQKRMEEFPQPSPRPTGAPLPLDGIKIVDFTHYIAGPFATMILADMGADVIKIEAPKTGDNFRRYPPIPPEIDGGTPYLWCNRNKRSVALDLKSESGIQTAKDLIAKADVVVENFSAGVMDRLGLAYEELRKTNPRLIYCAVSAYGRTGSYKDRLGFDPIAQAESGFISMNGYPDREGVRALTPVMDITTAMIAANGILGALLARGTSGEGQYLDVALYDSAFLMTGYANYQELYKGEAAPRYGNVSPDTSPSAAYRASDGSFYINSGNDRLFRRLLTDVLDMPEMADDPRFKTNADRIAHRAEIDERIQKEFETKPRAYWSERMRKAGVPCGEIRSLSEAIRAPEAKEREIMTRIPHPQLGWIPNIRLPIQYEKTPLADPRRAPAVGEDTDAVIADWLGRNSDQDD
ncbi:CaiB/BaiF CoA-transferase family protein [Paracoccus sp. SCSIO 75233]|uniref:CaiB/BaiF CoA transferase family protein n=1 Tax=Paracoccus sp. SCSIO 75233 TaxID=3017782 RepID=UPI0022F14342|nr:CoA transferase [Paracoccus sp. SCSIO 75233]WBU53913.1 CoA transferase [Paracoccus sp. SCSIO 75233]